MNVAGNEEIELSVSVVIAEGSAGGPGADLNARGFSYVSERAIVVVAIEAVLAVVGDVEVGPAVVVVVADRAAEAPAVIGDASHLRNFRERAVVVVAKERGVRRSGFAVQCVVG